MTHRLHKKTCECKQFCAVARSNDEVTKELREHQNYRFDPENHRPEFAVHG